MTKDTNGTYYAYYSASNGQDVVTLRADSPDGLEWFNATVAFPPSNLQGDFDAIRISDVFVIVDRTAVVPGEVFTEGRLKLHNEGASL